MKVTVQKATLEDAEAIHAIIEKTRERNFMLSRPLGEIFEHIREFSVAKAGGEVVGCVALHIYWKDIAEVRTLAVLPKYRRKGIGTKLAGYAMKEAKKLGIPQVFTLTTVGSFFENLSFKKVERNTLPMKIWADCIRCPYFANCIESAYVKEL